MKNNILSILILFVFFGQHSCKKDVKIQVPVCSLSFSDISSLNPFDEQYQGILDKYSNLGFPGVSALVYTPTDGLWLGTSGMSRIETNQEVQVCDLFHSGSAAKLFSVVTALKMAEDGYFNLDDKIDKYLPTRICDKIPNGHEASIRQLMNHSSGIPDHDDEIKLMLSVVNKQGKLPSAEEQLEYLYNNSPLFDAGKGAEYSSANTVLLGLIMDEVYGKHHSYGVSDYIIDNLGLNNTYYKNETGYPSPQGLVNSYSHYFSSDQLYNVSTEAQNYCLGSQADAGIIASSFDFFSFLKAVFEEQLITEATLAQMKEYVSDTGSGRSSSKFGLGLLIEVDENGEIVRMGHDGGTLGGVSNILYYPKSGAYIVLLSNFTTDMNMEVDDRFYGEGVRDRNSIIGEFETIITK